ncbi:MAG: tRNA adenosine(34) deaminase TadA [Clostridia bacterium]|nr:tRNA adenosine(34) deaminase TadA [Clostridia bacterium]
MEQDKPCKVQKHINEHEYFMNEALKEAKKAYKKDETPIGAVIVKDGNIIARAHNEKEQKIDATLHAEMTAIRKASKKLATWRLNECDMYVTLEPCAMCAGALIQSRVGRLFIGTADPKAGAVGSVIDVLSVDKFNHKVEVTYGILEEKCSSILKDFFKELRARKKAKNN